MPTPEETAQTPAAAPAPMPPLQHETNGARIYEAVKQELERGQTK